MVMSVEGVVLAAGASSRTAPENKLALPLAGHSVLERSLQGMRPFCDHIYVVTGFFSAAVEGILKEYKDITLVYNPEYEAGMYRSVKAGIIRTHADAVFLLPGDCPFADAEVYRALLSTTGDVVVPLWRGRAGHPVLLRHPAVTALLADRNCGSLRAYISAWGPAQVEVDCPGILKDIDTQEDYRAALESSVVQEGGL